MTVEGNNCGVWSWGRSLLLKNGILGLGLTVVWWMGWPQPDRSPLPPVVHQSIVSQLSSPKAKDSFPIEALQPPAVKIKEANLQPAYRTLLVDINLGSRKALEALPGIGEKLADRIVTYRSLHGDFQQVDDLVQVSGIGKKRLKRLESFVKAEERKK